MIEIVVRVALALVLGGAALAKLLSPRTSEAALATFGFAAGAMRRGAWVALIVTELVLAAGVALGSDAAAFGAAALMAMFAALMGTALMRGKAGAPCACFGARSTIGPLSVLRNLALAAGFAAVPFLPDSDPSADAWLALGLGSHWPHAPGWPSRCWRWHARWECSASSSGPRGRSRSPARGRPSGPALLRSRSRLAFDGHAELGLAVFTSEGCHLCQTLAPAIENVALDPLVVVGVFDESAEPVLWRELEIPGSPFAIAAGRDGTVLAKGTFNNLAQLESVLATAERRRREGTPEAARLGPGRATRSVR